MTGKKKTVDVDELIQMMAERLATWSGYGIAEVAKEVMGDSFDIIYEGDSLFEVNDRRN